MNPNSSINQSGSLNSKFYDKLINCFGLVPLSFWYKSIWWNVYRKLVLLERVRWFNIAQKLYVRYVAHEFTKNHVLSYSKWNGCWHLFSMKLISLLIKCKSFILPFCWLLAITEWPGQSQWNGAGTILPVNPLWPSDAIWWQRSGSTLAQVMTCCLTAPSHYLNQCWLIISEVQ